MKKGFILAGAAVLALSAGLTVYFSGGGQSVTTERAAIGNVTVAIDVSGEVYPSVTYKAYHPLGGKIQSVNVKEGDTVSAGQALMTMDVTKEKKELEQAQTAMAEANKNMGDIQAQSLQNTALQAAQSSACDLATFYGAVTGIGAGRAREELEKKEAAETAATGEQESLQQIIDNESVKSGITGKVLSLSAGEGDTVSPGQPLAEIGNLDSLRIRVYVNERDAAQLAENMQAVFTVEGTSKTMKGTVERIGSKLIEADGAKKCEVVIRPEDELSCLPGSTADVSIIISTTENAVTIPIDAIVEGNTVYVAKSDGTMEKTPVTIGLTDENAAEVLSGVYAGDKVILNPSEELKDGEKYVEDSGD